MRLFKDKRFRYGTFSTVMMLLAVVMFVLVNLLAGEFDYTRDLTAEQIFSLTDESRDFAENLQHDVRITVVARTGQEHPQLPVISRITNRLLDEYTAASSRITVETRDPLLNPALIHRFAADAGLEAGVPDHSIVVEALGEIRVIQPHEMIGFEFNPFTGASRITSYNIESEITRAIHHVTQGAAAVIYYVVGSGEMPLSPQFIAFLESENFIVREANLVLGDVSEDADILFIPMPARDWTEPKTERILSFLRHEGNAFFAMDITTAETPNLTRVLNEYGLNLTGRVLLEGNDQSILDMRAIGRSRYMIPDLVAHDITANLLARGFANMLPFFPAELVIQDAHRQTLEFETLWQTTSDAFSRGLDSDAETLSFAPGDVGGIFDLAVAVTDRIWDAAQSVAIYTRIVATSNIGFIDPWFTAYVGEGNWHFALNSLRWMLGQPPSIRIPLRFPPGQQPMIITDGTANILGGAAMGGIPLITLGIGAFIWFKRRHS
ncbi:MAG: GldG family protein [Defluviitaleaceae bacterium]|nr:GldG family protein [Defluviitaleaceae bacterium]